ncbi:MAG: YfhO family protein [Parcubacteria group bacterium]|nr:YfhO family protein [Parcubacteria group bacterium]
MIQFSINKLLLIILLFIVATLFIFWPILFGGMVVNDHYGFDLGTYKFFKDFGGEWKDHLSLKLWWPDYLGGLPVYVTQISFFTPLFFILYKFFSGFAVYNWLTVFNFIFGGLAMYWFCRTLKLSKIASAVGGLAYIFSQNNIYWGLIPGFSNVFVFIPLFFGALLKISENRKIFWFWGALIAAYGLTAPNTQVVFFTLVIGFFWAVFLTCFHNFNYESNKAAKFRPILGYISFIAGGAVLASFWLLPTINYMQLSTRGEALKYGDLVFDFMRIADPLRFIYPYIELPQFTGLVSLGIVPNYYIGAMTFLLAIAAIFLVRKNKIIAFWTGVAAFSFLVRVKWTGIFWALHFLPGFDRFRGAFHWAFFGTFALAILAGFALDNLDKIKESRHFGKFIKSLKIFGWANIAAIVGIFLTGLFRSKILDTIFQFFDSKIYQGTRKFPLEHYHGVISSEFNKFLNAFSFSNYHFTISFLSVLLAILIFVLYQKGKINTENFKKFALVFVFLNLIFIWQGYYKFIPISKITEYPDTVSFIKNNYPKNEHYRYFRFYPPEMYQQFSVFSVKDWDDYKLKTLESNIGPYFDMDGLGGSEPALSRRVADMFNEIGLSGPTTISGKPWMLSPDLSLSQKISRFSSLQNQNLFSMLNIKYIFSSFKLPNFKLIYKTTATEKNIPVYIYENPNVMPRIYFAKSVKYVNSESVFEELLKVKDFRELSLVECVDNCPKPSSKLQAPSSIVIEEFQSQLVKIKTKTSQGQWLIYSDANLPTWEAYIDNKTTPIYTANYLFKSVFVPEGKHEVMFKYPGLWGQDKAAFKNLIFNF